jgi:hypothetical protein
VHLALNSTDLDSSATGPRSAFAVCIYSTFYSVEPVEKVEKLGRGRSYLW